MNEATEIRDALAQLDRRLGEIRQHVGRILQDAQAPPGPRAPAGPEDSPLAQAPPEDSPLAQAPPEDSPLAQAPPEPPPPPQPPVPTPTPAPTPEDAPPESPAAAAAPSPPPVSPQQDDRHPGHADAQVEQLQRLREELIRGTRELIRSYERQLDTLETSFAGALTRAPVFEGVVALVVTGVAGVRALSELEDAIRLADGVDDAAVIRYAGGEARIEVTLARPVELTRELARVLLPGCAIETTAPDEIMVELDAPREPDASVG